MSSASVGICEVKCTLNLGKCTKAQKAHSKFNIEVRTSKFNIEVRTSKFNIEVRTSKFNIEVKTAKFNFNIEVKTSKFNIEVKTSKFKIQAANQKTPCIQRRTLAISNQISSSIGYSPISHKGEYAGPYAVSSSFCFGNNYLQIAGTAMGTRVALTYANIFMSRHVYTYPEQPLLWARFIDDIFLIWEHGAEALDKFINHFIE